MNLPCTTGFGAEDAMNTMPHLSLRAVNGGQTSVHISLKAPPAEEGLWETQAFVHLRDRAVHVEQGWRGIVRVRMEPPGSELPVLRVWRNRPLPGREPPPQ